jgi:hypothetical protein
MFNVGDTVRVKEGYRGMTAFNYLLNNKETHEVVALCDDGLKVDGSYFLPNVYFEIIEEKKQMKREDKINIEMTLQDAAWLYAISARANGTVGYSLYKTLKSFVDPDGVAYNKFIADKFNLIDYRAVQEGFEAEIFGRKSAEQEQLDILMQQITDLQQQAEKLQGIIGK